MSPTVRSLLFPLVLCALIAGPTHASDQFRAVVLFIGDGFDDQHVTMARNYLTGQSGRLLLDNAPVRAAVQVETVNASGDPVYVADSANTATTLATGVVTSIGRIGTAPDDSDVVTLVERAVAAKLRTGLVSTSSVTDATPAAFIAHTSHRGCENPVAIRGGERYGMPFPGCPADRIDAGGPGSIAHQIALSPLDVVLGGGGKHFATADPDTGVTPAETAQKRGWNVIADASAITEAAADQPLLGLFAPSHLPVRLRGTEGRVAEAGAPDALTSAGEITTAQPLATMRCESNPEFADTPTLAAMTEAALARLSAGDSPGFFLMVESASIDKQSHARNPCGSIGEVAQLEEAVAAALAFAETHPQTLVLVTADHAQAAQIIPDSWGDAASVMPQLSPGRVARIETPEGSVMRVNYATTTARSELHTGANVPLFGNAVATEWVPPYLRQRDLHAIMLAFLGLDDDAKDSER